MFILEFLAFIAFDFWYNLIVLVVLGIIAMMFQYDKEGIAAIAAVIMFGFWVIEMWNIMVAVHGWMHLV